MRVNTERTRVRGTACRYDAPREEVYEALKWATEPLASAWKRLEAARTIAVKFNQDKRPRDVVTYHGHRQQLVSDSVAYAVLRLLKERTDAEIFCADVSYYATYLGSKVTDSTNIAAVLHEMDVEYVDGTKPPYVVREVPDGNGLFRYYPVMKRVAEADAVVSVAKMKNHKYMGITGCLKNLFGLMPCEPPGIDIGRPRPYYHHLIRMPYMLTDLARIYDPVLNIVDGLVGQAGQEWGRGIEDGQEAVRISNVLLAGENPVAVDACMARMMGHDPEADWPEEPFLRERNALKVAAAEGYGTTDEGRIDFISEVEPASAGTYYCSQVDGAETILSWRRSMCEQALGYRDHPGRYSSYVGEYVLVQADRVLWHSPEGRVSVSRRRIAGKKTDYAIYMKYVDPEETERERYDIYEDTLKRLT